MIFPLKYNTASQEVPLGFFLDTSTGNIEQTSLTIANTDIKLWKSGATTLANKNSGGATHISNGIYYCVLDATDTNTYGPLEIFIHVSGALAFHKVCTVINSDAYDALMSASSGSIRSTVTAMSAGVITSTAIADELFYTSDQISQDVWEYTNRTLTSSGTAAIDYTQVANAVWDELLSLHTVSGSAGKQLSSTVTSSGAVYVNIAGAEIADAVWNAETATYNVAGSMGRALTSTGTAVIDASDVWNYGTRTLTSSTGNATLANQEIIINHLTDIKGDGWTDEDLVAIMTAIENGTWGGFGV